MSIASLCPYCLGEIELPRDQCPFCGKDLQNHNPTGALALGTQLSDGRYTIGEYVSADGEGLLYRGVDNQAAVFLTIKEYFPVTLSSGRTRAGSIQPKAGAEVLFKTIRMDFEDLYSTLQKITPATGLVNVVDVMEANNTVYAVMESARGVTLTRYMELHAKKPLSARENAELLRPVMEGVAYLHKHGIMHRGICPDNILLPIDGSACLTGYATQGLRTAGGELRPKLYSGYSAPEQYSANEFEGFFTDVYALAAVLYRMVTGRVPVPVPQRETGEEMPEPNFINPSVPAYISRVISCGLRMNTQARMQTVEEFMAALSDQSEANAMLGKSPQKGKKQKLTGSIRSAGRLFTVFAVLLVVLVILVFWIVLRIGGSGGDSDPVSTPQQTSQPQTQTIRVPDFVGMSYSDIRANEEYLANFRFAITEAYSDTQEEGTVLMQDPVVGSSVDTETKAVIRLTISKGITQITMPDITGYSQADAEQLLYESGISFRVVEVENNGEYAQGCVAYCDKDPGETFDKETTVTVYIAGERTQSAETTE